MGMSSHVVGIRPATADYKKKLKAYKACEEAGVPPPKELAEYFGELADPDPKGMQVKLDEDNGVTKFNAEYQQGFDVDITKLPEGVTILRFYNAY